MHLEMVSHISAKSATDSKPWNLLIGNYSSNRQSLCPLQGKQLCIIESELPILTRTHNGSTIVKKGNGNSKTVTNIIPKILKKFVSP